MPDADADADADAVDPTEPETPVRRSVLLGVVVGIVVALAAMALIYSLIAIPMYVLAKTESSGLDRPFIRNGLLIWGLPIGIGLGMACGVVMGVWYGRGGRLPTDRTPW